jgi:hypothetical protein
LEFVDARNPLFVGCSGCSEWDVVFAQAELIGFPEMLALHDGLRDIVQTIKSGLLNAQLTGAVGCYDSLPHRVLDFFV